MYLVRNFHHAISQYSYFDTYTDIDYMQKGSKSCKSNIKNYKFSVIYCFQGIFIVVMYKRQKY